MFLVSASCLLLRAQRLPTTVTPEHYSLSLTPDLGAATFSGEEKIDVTLQQPVDAITLNAAEISFGSVSALAAGKNINAEVTFDEKKEEATFSFAQKLPTGPVTLTIAYSGKLNNDLRGFYLSKTSKRSYAVTQFEATDARRAFPCFDEPAFKATFDVTLVVNKGDTAISNTNIVADTPSQLAGKHSVRFATTPRMSTYLVAFLVGDFKCVSGESEGVPIRACTTPGNEQMGHYAVSAAENMLRYYNQYFGIKYPMPKLDMIALPDFEAGAMENFGAITYRETDLLIDEKIASLEQKQRVALVVAHEMAHQWFGDMVTMQWWNNVWLNEGFATWMENKAVAQWKPEWHMSQSVAADLQQTLNLDARDKTRTIRAEAETPEEINEMFDGIAYGKAGAVLLMVENYVGEETFRRGVHNYLAAHLYANATAEDFWNAQTAASHKPVDRIMLSLVTQPGVPLLTFSEPVASGLDTHSVKIAQRRFFLNPRHPPDAEQSWTLPVCLRAEAGTSAEQESCSVISEMQPALQTAGSTLFFANRGGKGYYRSSYPPDILAKLQSGIESELAPEERITLLGDELALMRAGQTPVGAYLDLVAKVRGDSSYYVLRGALTGEDQYPGGVAEIERVIASDGDEQAAVALWVRNTFGRALQKLGEPAPGESDDRSELRTDLFAALGELGRDSKVIERSKQIADQYLKAPESVDRTLGLEALRIAATNGDAAFFDHLQTVHVTSSNPQMQSIALFTLGRFRDPGLERRALDYVVSGKVRNQDSGRLLGRMLKNSETRDIAWTYLTSHWDKVAAQFPKGGGGSVVVGASGFCTAEQRDQVVSFFASHKVEGTERALGRAIDQINDCIALRAAQQPALKIWLQSQN